MGENVLVRVTLYADYCEWPLWAPGGQLDENALPLSDSTKRRIKAWLRAYGGWVDEVPAWRPPPGTEGTDAEEHAWVKEGEALCSLIQEELGPGYQVDFET